MNEMNIALNEVILKDCLDFIEVAFYGIAKSEISPSELVKRCELLKDKVAEIFV